MERHERRRWVARERKQKFPSPLLLCYRYARKRRRLSWFHRHATKVNRSLESSLDDRFEKVAGTHRRTARGEKQVRFLKPFADGLDVCVDTRGCFFFNRVIILELKKILASLVGYYPKVDDRVSHACECCLQRGPISIVYPSPSVVRKRDW